MGRADKFSLNLKLSHKGLILIAVPLIFELGIFLALFQALESAEQSIQRETNARSVISHANAILMRLFLLVSNIPGSYLEVKLNPQFLERYHDDAEAIHRHFQALKQLFAGDTENLQALNQVHAAVDRSLLYVDEGVRWVKMDNLPMAWRMLADMKALVAQLQRDVEQIVAPYRTIAEASQPLQTQKRQHLKNLIIAAILMSIFLAVSLAGYFYNQMAQRLQVLIDNAMRFAKQAPLRPPLSGDDEIGRLDTVFHQMAEEIARSAKQKQEFVAMISHDLRTPLTALSGALTMLQQGRRGDKLTPTSADMVARCQTSLKRLICLINDLLDIEKLESGQTPTHFEQLPVAYVLENAVDTVKDLAGQRSVRLEVPQTDAEIYADSSLIVRVLVNLLSNALKFAPSDSTIQISVEDHQDRIKVSVSDQGPGIPPEQQAKIFERYHQGTALSGSDEKGSGLGLAICKQIIQQHHGRIGVKTNNGGGSTFWFSVSKNVESMRAVAID